MSWLNSSTLLASAVGAIVFGRVADILGRKRIYGYEVLILAIGALASAFAPNYTFLLVCRVILGIGIGGDYPVSATIMSEYSGKRDRGKMVGLVFAMQGAGLIFGPLFASVLLWSGLSDGYTTCPTGPARQLSPHRSLPRPRLSVLTGATGRKVHPILLGHRSGAPSLLDVIV